jgi:hypothetical protein
MRAHENPAKRTFGWLRGNSAALTSDGSRFPTPLQDQVVDLFIAEIGQLIDLRRPFFRRLPPMIVKDQAYFVQIRHSFPVLIWRSIWT